MVKGKKRPSSQRKLPHPGRGGRVKNKATNEYGEIKKNTNLSLTETARIELQSFADEYGLAKSKIIEILVRSPDIINLLKRELKDESVKAEKLREEMAKRNQS